MTTTNERHATIIQHTANGMYLVEILENSEFYSAATFDHPYQYLEYCVCNGVDIDNISIEFKYRREELFTETVNL